MNILKGGYPWSSVRIGCVGPVGVPGCWGRVVGAASHLPCSDAFTRLVFRAWSAPYWPGLRGLASVTRLVLASVFASVFASAWGPSAFVLQRSRPRVPPPPEPAVLCPEFSFSDKIAAFALSAPPPGRGNPEPAYKGRLPTLLVEHACPEASRWQASAGTGPICPCITRSAAWREGLRRRLQRLPRHPRPRVPREPPNAGAGEPPRVGGPALLRGAPRGDLSS